MNYNEFQRMLDRSMSYEIQGSVLTITEYYTGKSVSLDLGCITEEMFEDLVFNNEEDE